MSVEITACDSWNWESVSNALQLQLKGSNYPSQFFFVNQLSPLPINGETMEFDIPNDYIQELTTNIGDLQSIVMALDDNDFGYCIKNMTIQISHDIYKFSADDYFGNGIILSAECNYSFRYLICQIIYH